MVGGGWGGGDMQIKVRGVNSSHFKSQQSPKMGVKFIFAH